MQNTLLATKLYIPSTRSELVSRSRLIEQLNKGLHRKLTLISAPAGFGKTTLVTEWITSCERPVAWLSLDEGESDSNRFLTYLIAALQTIEADIGDGVLSAFQSTQPIPTESILTALLNDISRVPENFVLVLDDYHLIDAQRIDQVLTFLLEHLPAQMHLVIATREDPQLPLARLRVRSQLTELRVADLRFTTSEAAEFLNQVMDLNLSEENVAALETRTEGWIAGLQLAALSMQGHQDASRFIQSFTGSHHFVLDYLMEEVLERQPESVQIFLLQTAILDRLTGPLCDALTGQDDGQQTLEYLEQANLFLVPLDNERRWYRYHHLFADLLRQRVASSPEIEGMGMDDLHIRASIWYEDHDLEVEAFQHAAAANDVERAACLMEGVGMPLLNRGGAVPVLNWLETLPTEVLDARPHLWVRYASALSIAGQITRVEEKLQAAEAALVIAAQQGIEPDDKTNDLVGIIAATRAMLSALAISGQPTGAQQKLQAAETALRGTELDDKSEDLVGYVAAAQSTLTVDPQEVETIIAQSRRALEYLHPDNLPVRIAATWMLGIAYRLQGDRAAARQAYTDVISIAQASGDIMSNLAATTGLGGVQETENQLYLAAESYRHALQLGDGQPLPVACCEAHLGLARICYEWNDLNTAQQHGQRSVELARRIENTDNIVSCEVFLARLQLAQGDVAGAAAILAEADQFVRQHNLMHRLPEVAATQVLILLRQGNLAAAVGLVEKHDLPISQARIHLAQGDPSAALAVLELFRQQMEVKGWADELLKVMVLQAVTHHIYGDTDQAVQLLGEALVLAEHGGFIRLFIDEGPLMAQLLHKAVSRGIAPDYTRQLLAAFSTAVPEQTRSSISQSTIAEPLSERELEVLQHIAEGLTNQEIADRLYLSRHTVKVHARNIYGKLDASNRTQAVARARELGILPHS